MVDYDPRQYFKNVLDDPTRRFNALSLSFILPSLLILILLMGFPIIFIFYLSFTNADIYSPTQDLIGMSNYISLIDSGTVYHALWNGVVFTGGSIAFQILVGLTFALILKRNFIGDSFARTAAIAPYLFPTIGVAIMWKWLLNPNYGFVNFYLEQFNIVTEPISFFHNPNFAMIVLIIANSWKFTPFVVVIFLARVQSIDNSLYEQAKISGASGFQMFKDITLPNLRSAFLIVLLLRGIWQFNKFDIVYLLTRGGPLNATTTLPVYIFNVGFLRGNLGKASSAAVIMFIILIAVSVIYFIKLKPSEEIRGAR